MQLVAELTVTHLVQLAVDSTDWREGSQTTCQGSLYNGYLWTKLSKSKYDGAKLVLLQFKSCTSSADNVLHSLTVIVKYTLKLESTGYSALP